MGLLEQIDYLAKEAPKATGQSQHPMKKGEEIGEIIIGKTK